MSGTTGASQAATILQGGGAGVVNFQYYPDSNRTHGVFVEVDATGADTGQYQQRALLIGQYSTGAPQSALVTPSVPMLISDPATSAAMFGNGSVLQRMIERFRALNAFTELWAAPIPDPVGTAATATIVTAGTSCTAAAMVGFYFGDDLVTVPVNVGDTPTIISNNISTDCVLNLDLPFSVVASAGTLTATAKNVGALHNDITLATNLGGQFSGQAQPGGMTFTITQPGTTGVGIPTLTALLAAMPIGDQTFDFIVSAYSDTTSLAALAAFMNDSVGRWSWMQMVYGHVFAAYRGTLATLATYGNGFNDQHKSILGLPPGTPTWNILAACDLGAIAAMSLTVDPGLPLQNVALNIMAPPVQNRFGISGRNTLLYDGISTFQVNDAGQCILDRVITTYQQNLAGAPSTSYLDIETMFSLMFLIRDMRYYLMTIFQRKKLVADGTVIPVGADWTTPRAVKDAMVARYAYQCSLGNAQGAAQFAASASYQKGPAAGEVKLLAPFNVDDQLRQIAMRVAFLKT